MVLETAKREHSDCRGAKYYAGLSMEAAENEGRTDVEFAVDCRRYLMLSQRIDSLASADDRWLVIDAEVNRGITK